MIEEGAECIPVQWIDKDKNDHLCRPGGPDVDPLHKARLVARGDLEKGYSRTGSPTADQEALFMVCILSHLTDFRSDAATLRMHTSRARRRHVRCYSVKHKVGCRTTMFLMLTTCWHSFRYMKQRTQEGTSGSAYARSCATAKACYSYARDGELQLILATHEDLVWACKALAKYIIANIESLLILGTEDVHIFRH